MRCLETCQNISGKNIFLYFRRFFYRFNFLLDSSFSYEFAA